MKALLLVFLSVWFGPYVFAQGNCYIVEHNYCPIIDTTVEVVMKIQNYLEDSNDTISEIVLFIANGNIDTYWSNRVTLRYKEGVGYLSDSTGSPGIVISTEDSLERLGYKMVISKHPRGHPFFTFFSLKLKGKVIFYAYSFDDAIECSIDEENSDWDKVVELYEAVKRKKQ